MAFSVLDAGFKVGFILTFALVEDGIPSVFSPYDLRITYCAFRYRSRAFAICDFLSLPACLLASKSGFERRIISRIYQAFKGVKSVYQKAVRHLSRLAHHFALWIHHSI
jgi:hypothetical protein